MYGRIQYCIKHGHDWEPVNGASEYRCHICGARMGIL